MDNLNSPQKSLFKQELGTKGWLITSFILSGLTFFAPVAVNIILMPVAFVFGIVSLFRTIKEKDTSKIILSVIAILLPVLIYFITRTYLSS